MALNLEDMKIKDKILYIAVDVEDVKTGGPVYNCPEGETLQIVPNTKSERQCLYVCGQGGSGKSYFTTQYVKEYKKIYPKNEIYVY